LVKGIAGSRGSEIKVENPGKFGTSEFKVQTQQTFTKKNNFQSQQKQINTKWKIHIKHDQKDP